MPSILILNGSPQKTGNTAILIDWFVEGIGPQGHSLEIISTASLKLNAPGCTSCRLCQTRDDYGCVIKDDASRVLEKMMQADIIVMATPLYFFSMSAQLKIIMDRMFSLYKWDNAAGTMKTALKGKRLVLLASAFEDGGLDILEQPFKLTADYAGMPFFRLVIPNAGTSGQIKANREVKEKTIAFGRQFC